MITIGIVGSPAGGKSTVAKYLQEFGATWINADQIAREVLEQADLQRQLIDHFGPEITDNQGHVDRSKLAARVFGDDDHKRSALKYLEGLIHPRTRLMIARQWKAAARKAIKTKEADQHGAHVAILDVPLLFEAGWDRACDEIWCVDSDRSQRLQRAKRRGWDQAQLADREASQLDITEKKRLSTVVIDNNGTLEQLRETVSRLWSSIQIRRNELVDNRHCLEDI